MYIADSHCDTLSGMLHKKEDFQNNNLQISAESIRAGDYEGYLQFMAVFVSPSLDHEKGVMQTNSMIEIFNSLKKSNAINHVTELNDLGKPGISGILALEGMYFTEIKEDILYDYYSRGVRCISLTWNPDNDFAGGILGRTGNGLTVKGLKIVERAFEIGMLVDVSHLSDRGFYEVAEIAANCNKPFAATHSNARRLCHHMRNLDDDMLGIIAGTGGFTGINMYSCFLDDGCSAGIDEVIKHIEYICSIAGSSHVGFGSDFDGIDRNKSAIDGPRDFNRVLERLLQLNYNEDDVRKIASGNILRVLSEVL